MCPALAARKIGTYALTWKWFHRVPAAMVAGLLYVSSQASISLLTSGQFNVYLIVAWVPLLYLLLDACLERPTARRSSSWRPTTR